MLKVVLLWSINDFPFYGDFSGHKVKAYCACPICGEQTCAKRLKHSRKLSYRVHHIFLPNIHPYQRQNKTFDGKRELNPPPTALSGVEVFKKVENLNNVVKKNRVQLKSDCKNC